MKLLLAISAVIVAAASQCSPGWQPANGFCYKVGETRVSEYDASQRCSWDNAYLAEILSAEETKGLQSVLKDVTEDVWFGAFRPYKNPTWEWYYSDDRISYTNWASPEAATRDVSVAGGFLSYNDGFKWDSVYPYGEMKDTKRYICQNCPQEKVCSDDACYVLGCVTARHRKRVCSGARGFNAEITSDAEKTFVDKYLQRFKSNIQVIVGATFDKTTKKWHWNKAQTQVDVPSEVAAAEDMGDPCLYLRRNDDGSSSYVVDDCDAMHYLCEFIKK